MVGIEEDPVTADHFLSNTAYSKLRFLAGTILPAFGTLYFAIAAIWNLPNAQEVLGTILAVQACLSVILGISSNSYEKSGAKYGGIINVTEAPDKTLFSLDLTHDPEELATKKEVLFKIESNVP